MQCPKCHIEMRAKTHYRTEGDESSDTPTRVHLVQEFYCRNASCPDFNNLVSTSENMVYEGT